MTIILKTSVTIVSLVNVIRFAIMVSNYKRKSNRASYSKENLESAVRAVKNGLSGYMAAKKFNIPRMTIMDHVNNRRTKSNTLGRNTVLPYEVERKLASSLHLMEKHGFGLSKAEMLDTVAEYVNKNKIMTPFKDGKPGNAWFTGFKKRHNLSVKKPQAVEYSRKKAINPFIVYPYFQLLEETLKKLNLMEKPAAIWNMDETSFSKDPAKTKIVGLKGHAATRVISSPGKDNTTVLLGANAQGDKLPPLIIYKGKHMWDAWVSPDAYPNTTYAATKNGWMESEVFEMYFKKSFLPAIGDERPVLLIYDGHATHVGLNIIEEARKANITILKLPAHTSHILQPLDLSLMKPFKDRWDQLLVQWQRMNVGAALSKKEFSRLIGLVWTQIDAQVLRNGFRKAGISPFIPKVVEEKLFDSLQLQHWKDLHRESQNSIDQVNPEESFIIREDETQSTKSDIKTLLSLSLDALTIRACIGTHKEHDDQQQQETPNYQMPESKKIKILEDRIISFEELLLMKLGSGNNIKTKRQKMGPGAEVITHDDVLKRKMEENIKNIKKEPKEIVRKIQKLDKSMESIPGPSGITKKSGKEQSQPKYISNKGKGIGKKSRVKEEQHKTTNNFGKKMRVRMISEDSTSVSDCISIYNDSDICSSDELSMETPDEIILSHSDNKIIADESKEVIHNCEFGRENKAIFDKEEGINYSVKDNVLVRYFNRKKWTYYIGYIEALKPGDYDDDEVYYTIRFYKTVKKPLKFILTKKLDRDDVPSTSVVKKISMTSSLDNPKILFLSNNEDSVYFS